MWLLGTIGATTIVQSQFSTAIWGSAMIITSLTASMAVNALVTGLIVFKIFKVLTPAERTLGSTGGSKLRHVIFMIIESGMALFAIQLIRLVFSILPESLVFSDILDYVVIFHQMLNVIIRSVYIYLFCFTDNIYHLPGCRTNNNLGAGLNETVLWWQGTLQGSCRKSLS